MSAMSVKASERREDQYVRKLEDRLIEIEMRLDRLLGLIDDKGVDPEEDRAELDKFFKAS